MTNAGGTTNENGSTGTAAPKVGVIIGGEARSAYEGERLLDLINRSGLELPQVCNHPQMGPIQTCDTCLVEIARELVRACATTVTDGMKVSSRSSHADSSRRAEITAVRFT